MQAWVARCNRTAYRSCHFLQVLPTDFNLLADRDRTTRRRRQISGLVDRVHLVSTSGETSCPERGVEIGCRDGDCVP